MTVKHEWSKFTPARVWLPRKIEGKWCWLSVQMVRFRMYDNPFSMTGFAFHKDWQLAGRKGAGE